MLLGGFGAKRQENKGEAEHAPSPPQQEPLGGNQELRSPSGLERSDK